jgi:hypothetical protein
MRNAETILDIIQHRSLESRLEIERLTSGLEGGCWKSAQSSNSLAAYPTARSVLRGGSGGNVTPLPYKSTHLFISEGSILLLWAGFCPDFCGSHFQFLRLIDAFRFPQ